MQNGLHTLHVTKSALLPAYTCGYILTTSKDAFDEWGRFHKTSTSKIKEHDGFVNFSDKTIYGKGEVKIKDQHGLVIALAKKARGE